VTCGDFSWSDVAMAWMMESAGPVMPLSSIGFGVMRRQLRLSNR
jgi:hypothetical protein